MEYKSFEIHVGKAADDGRYPIELLSSPRGRLLDYTRQESPLNDPNLLAPIQYLSRLVARSNDLKQLGERLYNWLFPDQIGVLFNRCLDDITAEEGLRIRLQIDDPQISLIPWEYCYLPKINRFFALRRATPIMRYIEQNYKVADLAGPKPKLLIALASPSHKDLKPLDEKGEEKLIRAEMDKLKELIDYKLVPRVTYEKLQDEVANNQYDIFHFIGHGVMEGGAGALAFEAGDAQRSLDKIDHEQLSVLLPDAGVKLIVLTACETAVHDEGDIFKGVAQSLVQTNMPAVVAMQFIVDYRVALDFTFRFYSFLASGHRLEKALTEARISAFGKEKISWGIPVLYMQAEDGFLWKIEEKEIAPPVVAPTPAVEIPKELRPYLQIMARRNNRLNLQPLDPDGRVKANMPLTSVFINVKGDLTTGDDISDTLPDAFRPYDSALAHIHNHRRLIILGAPGSGKTSLLRFLAHKLAANLLDFHQDWFSQQWTADTPVPVLLQLQAMATAEFDPQSPTALWKFARQQINLDPEADELQPALLILSDMAKEGQVIFLLDGLDDLPGPRQRNVWRAIKAMEDSLYANCRWVITCRTRSFIDEYTPPDAAIQVLRPLDETAAQESTIDQRITQFIQDWYDALPADKNHSREKKAVMAGHLQQAAHDPHLLPLAQNPMLLTTMAIVHTYYGPLPETRAYLYQVGLDILLQRWQRGKENSAAAHMPAALEQLNISRENIEPLLWEIGAKAYRRTVEGGDSTDITETEVLRIARKQRYFNEDLPAIAHFLKYVDHRAYLLQGPEAGGDLVYTFPYPPLQAYLAACYLAADGRFLGQAADLARQGATWREVLNLAAGKLALNDANWKTAFHGIRKALPTQIPERNDESGWSAIWLAAEMALMVRPQVKPDDEEYSLYQEMLEQLQAQLWALLASGRLPPRHRADAASALALLGDPRPGVCTPQPDMIPIPAGSFLMGSECYEVTLNTFAIARYPVTNAQFRQFIEQDGYSQKEFWTDEGWHFRKAGGWTEPAGWQDVTATADNKPVTGVCWFEALAYTQWLSQITERSYRLPTDAEWERAARHSDGREWPWGNAWQDGIINSAEAGVRQKTAVGIFPDGRTDCGAQDMSGNVWEWCSTRWGDENDVPYPAPYQPDDGREELDAQGASRIMRGGSFRSPKLETTTTYPRGSFEPQSREDDVGFRVVMGG